MNEACKGRSVCVYCFFLVPHNFKNYRLFLWISQQLFARTFVTFFDAHDLDHLALCPRLAVNVDVDHLRVKLVDHLLLGCAKRESRVNPVAVANTSGKLMAAIVSGVALDVEHYVEESLFGFHCISHNWVYCLKKLIRLQAFIRIPSTSMHPHQRASLPTLWLLHGLYASHIHIRSMILTRCRFRWSLRSCSFRFSFRCYFSHSLGIV